MRPLAISSASTDDWADRSWDFWKSVQKKGGDEWDRRNGGKKGGRGSNQANGRGEKLAENRKDTLEVRTAWYLKFLTTKVET